MSDIAIRVENLGKQYRIGKAQQRHDTLRDALVAGLQAPFSRMWRNRPAEDREDTIWALKDVSFDVKHGEVVGIIGRNGAGKSTLLKILSRITEPTTGRAVVNGRVGSLLEVGTGFHPELTGRENIYLNGAILGMKRAEIDRKFDEIVDFAEIEKFLDTPVKRYSSGMYVRLAFAVAAHLEPEILIVDEVLAVGDVAFQKKCLGKMSKVANEGRTVLFVSHNIAVVEAICQRAMLVDKGLIITADRTGEVCTAYQALLSGGSSRSKEITRVDSGILAWHGLQNRQQLGALSPNEDLSFQLRFQNRTSQDRRISVDLALANERGERVLHARWKYLSPPLAVPARCTIDVVYTFVSPGLAPGAYSMTVYFEEQLAPILWIEDIDACRISGQPYFGIVEYYEGFTGAVIPMFKVSSSLHLT